MTKQVPPNQFNWNISDKEYKTMEDIVKRNPLPIGNNENNNSGNKIYNWLTDTDQDLANRFKKQFMNNKNQLNIMDDLSKPESSQIIEYLISNSKFEKHEIINLFLKFARSFIKAMVLSKKNETELITFIIDAFCRYSIKHNFHNNEETEYIAVHFVNELNFIGIKQDGVKTLIGDIIKDFYNRFGRYPHNSPRKLIDDNINKYVAFILNLNRYFNRNDSVHFWLYNCYPIQFDLWIIPPSTIDNIHDNDDYHPDHDMYHEYYDDDNKVTTGFDEEDGKYNDNDDDDDDDDDDDKQNEQIVIDAKKIANIGSKLSSQHITYYVDDIDDDYEWIPASFGKHFANFQKKECLNGYGSYGFKKKNVEKFDRYKRFIMIYDMRKQVWNGKKFESQKRSKLYIFKALKGLDEFSKDHFKYFYQYQSICYSNKCLLPKHCDQKTAGYKGKNPNINLFETLSGYMFGFSYHLINRNCGRLYWYSHGTSFRFYKNDIINIWPKFFRKKQKKEQLISSKLLNILNEVTEFRDVPFDKFCKLFNIKIGDINLNNLINDNKINHNENTKTNNIKTPKLKLKRLLHIKLSGEFYEDIAQTFTDYVNDEKYATDGLEDDIEDINNSDIIQEIVKNNQLSDEKRKEIHKFIKDVIQNYKGI